MKLLSLIFAVFLTFLLVQCSDPSVSPVDNGIVYDKGGNGGGNGGGGGHTTTAGNNLSFPALLADGYQVTDITEDLFTVVYTGEYSGLTAEEIEYLLANGPWYPQQTEGNVWQADYEYITETTYISWIDWGDAIEAVNPKLRRPYRLELSIYAPVVQMEGFKMAELEFPSSKDELQGTNTTTYLSDWASVASPNGNIVVQRFEGVDPGTLTWDAALGQWTGAEAPITGFGFSVENNVGGKLIFGASLKGWKPAELGAHRITFYLDNSVVMLSSALIGNYLDGSFTEVIQGETNTPVVDIVNNLTYVDVTVEPGGGGH